MVVFIVLGAVISVLAGFFGIGGGFILTPTLLLIGLSPVEAIATSLLFTIATSLSGFIAHLRLKNICWREGIVLGISGAFATQVARPFVFFLQSKNWDELVIPALYIILLSFFIFKLLTQHQEEKHEVVMKPSLLKTIPKLIVIGFTAGFVSTTLGVGGGFIIVPLVITFLQMDPKRAVGSSLFAVFFIVVVGFLSYSVTVTINYELGLFLMVGGIIGSQFGAGMTRIYDAEEIQQLLVRLYIVTLVSVTLKLLQVDSIGLSVLFIFLIYFLIKSLIAGRRRKKFLLEEKQTGKI